MDLSFRGGQMWFRVREGRVRLLSRRPGPQMTLMNGGGAEDPNQLVLEARQGARTLRDRGDEIFLSRRESVKFSRDGPRRKSACPVAD